MQIGKDQYKLALTEMGLETDAKKEERLLAFRGRGAATALLKEVPSWEHGEPRNKMRLLGAQLQPIPADANAAEIETR